MGYDIIRVFKSIPAPILPSGEPPQGVVLHHAQIFTVFYRVSISIALIREYNLKSLDKRDYKIYNDVV